MTTAILQKCLKVLKTTETDNERLAALLMIAKVTKSDECDDICMKEIFDAIGLQFLSRLLRTGVKTSEESSSQAFKNVAVNVISSFCSVPGVIDDPGFGILLPHIAILTLEKSADEEILQLVEDSYDCLMRIVALKQGPELLVNSKCVPPICQAVIGKYHASDRGLQVLLHLCVACGRDTWTNSENYLLVLVQQLTHDIDTEMTKWKFDLCNSLAIILMSVPENELNKPDYTTWQQVIQKLLFNILQNKLASDQRASILKLCSVLIEQYDVQWCLQWDQTDSKFLLLLVHLSCIEVRMALDTEDLKKISSAGSLLVTCYSILEHVIQYMTSGPSLQLGAKQITQLHSALVGAFNAIIHFLSRMAAHPHCQEVMPLVIASIRVLGSWIAEETTALKQEVVTMLPFLIQTSCEMLYKIQDTFPSTDLIENDIPCTLSTMKDKDQMEACEPQTSSDRSLQLNKDTNNDNLSLVKLSDTELNPYSSVEVLQFLMPGFCHLSAEDTARKVMLNCDMISLLYQYLVYQFARLQLSERTAVNKEPQMVLTTACGVLLNIIVLEGNLVVEKPVFSEILTLTVQKFNELEDGNSDNFVLRYNLMLVGLLILRQRNENTGLSRAEVEDFFKQCVVLLQKAHRLNKPEKDCSTLLSNHEQWQDISEYWKLAMQVITVCIKVFPWLPGVLLSGCWLPSICSMLLSVKSDSVEKDVQVAFGELLKTTAIQSSAAKIVIRDGDGIQLCRKYKWTELEKLLK